MSTITTYYESDPSFVSTKSVFYDGSNQHIDAGDIVELKAINKLTTSIWIKPITGTALFDAFLTKWDFMTNGAFAFGLSASIAEFQIFIANALGDNGGNNFTTTNANLVLNIWYNVVVVYDGTLIPTNRVRVYLDGVLLTGGFLGTIPITLTSATATVKFGRFGGTLLRHWNGNMNNPALFPNVAFNQADVNEIFSGGTPMDARTHSKAAFLNNNWRMGNGDTHPTIIDNVGTANGTMINMTPANIVNDSA